MGQFLPQGRVHWRLLLVHSLTLSQQDSTEMSAGLELETARQLLYSMKRIRLVEEMIADRYGEGKMRCPTHLSIGQEAPAAAAGLVLRRDDFAVSGHRAHAHYLGKGGDLRAMIAEIYGKATGCSAGKGGSMHLVDTAAGFMGSTAIVGGTIPIGVGLGLSIKLGRTDQISTVFLGDGAAEEGVFYEAVNFAALKQLPVLFICENNLYSVYSSLRVRQPEGRRIHEMVAAMGIPARAGDGNNAVESYLLIADAARTIRQGGGPQFLELFTYRWREHCGPNYDNDIGYRTEAEFNEWKEKDPIRCFEEHLRSCSHLDVSETGSMEQEIRCEVEGAFAYAEMSPFPEPCDAFSHLFKS